MRLARSTYYYRGRRQAAEKRVLCDRIEALCAEFPRDGYRRITHQLRAEGLVVNHKAIARLMRQNGLQVGPCVSSCAPRTATTTARSFPTLPVASAQPAPISSGSAISRTSVSCQASSTWQ
jgi:transposase InsO family protein